ncbi:hypothetical protein K488DRAFT_81863 [Vararia minispora EC-137]|uniref:Uncharacterized protein n=1 Tax=Vararia minispora EC-137 TaxID=1314806 RepID=A0ACB8QY25_9AGAM|nr:hypothetical protein K488DRAFT_81863 [Vararia minispora EC-137]
MSSVDDIPLPFGWIKEYDPATQHNFYVDTKANPPRSIWTHPYEDPQYLDEHPDVREKVGSMMRQLETDRVREELNNPSPPMPARRNSFSGRDNDDMRSGPTQGSAAVVDATRSAKKRGFFGKMKDKAIGTKEEREAYKREMARVEMERRRQREEALRAQRAEYQKRQQEYARQQAQWAQQHPQYYPQAGPSQGYGYQYGPPAGVPYGYGQPQYVYQQRQSSGIGAGSGLALLGGLAGGLLLGDLLF